MRGAAGGGRCCIFPDNSAVSQGGNTHGNNNAKEARSNRLVGPSYLVLRPREFLLFRFYISVLRIRLFLSSFLPSAPLLQSPCVLMFWFSSSVHSHVTSPPSIPFSPFFLSLDTLQYSLHIFFLLSFSRRLSCSLPMFLCSDSLPLFSHTSPCHLSVFLPLLSSTPRLTVLSSTPSTIRCVFHFPRTAPMYKLSSETLK